ncbi:MAG: polysaccharide biosynthesis protein [Clostridiales Family XIII bacterium]|jgi:stage V sporulation protein B|nr:polysaccharide biosynthesis protein [Clostridiales Family XIII bacterium]
MSEESKKIFIKGAFILAVAGILVKILGAFFRIPLANIIGPEGMAYYQSAYSIYSLLYIVATLGLPVAISKLISEKIASGDYFGARRTFRLAVSVFFIVGIVLFLLSFIFARNIVAMYKDVDGAIYGIRVLSFSFLFITVNTIFRGYFQGLQNMKPTALSQIIEQLARVLFGLFLAFLYLKKGAEFATAGAVAGTVIGAFFSLLLLAIIYYKKSKSKTEIEKIKESKGLYDEGKKSLIVKNIFAISIPVAVGSIVMPVMNFIDNIIITHRLSFAGFEPEQVRILYGRFSSFVVPIVDMPISVIVAIAISIVPAVAITKKAKNEELFSHNIILSLRITSIFAFPCMFGLIFLANPILTLLYPMQYKEAVASVNILIVFSLILVPLALITTLTGILQGLSKQLIPVINLAIGAVLKILITYVLTGFPSINVIGACIGTIVAYLVALCLNFYFMIKYSKIKIPFYKVLILPCGSAIIMGFVALLSHIVFSKFAGNTISTGIAIIIGAFIYFAIMFLSKGITKEDLKLILKKRIKE